MLKAKVEHCRHGHPKNKVNIYIVPKTGAVGCRSCRRAASLKGHLRRNFNNKREIVIKRDGEKCLHCGMNRDEHRAKYGRDITVDHIDGKGSWTPVKDKNNDITNLQTLCLSCHSKKDSVRHGPIRMTLEDANDIRMFYRKGITRSEIMACYQTFHIRTISSIIRGDSWKNQP